MNRKGSIPPMPGWYNNPDVTDLLNNLIVAIGDLHEATKGCILVHNGTEFIVLDAPASNGQVLTADDTTASGVKWA